jgi:hypothetical protein
MLLLRKIVISVRVIDVFKSFWELLNKSSFWKYSQSVVIHKWFRRAINAAKAFTMVLLAEGSQGKTMGTTVS